MRVVVIGGGPAGLTAAYTLMKFGVSPVLLETRGRLGGRIHTEHRDGFIVDLGAQFLSRRYAATLAMCRELGLECQLSQFRLLAGVLRDDMVRSGMTLMTWRAAISFLRLISWVSRNGSRLDASHVWNNTNLGGVSTEDFALDRYNRALLEEWLQPFISGATAAMPTEVAAACTLSYLWYNLAPCLTFRGGLAALVDALSGVLPEARLNATATRVILQGNRAHAVEYTQDGRRELIEADGIIVATPAPQAAALFSRSDLPDKNFLHGVTYSRSIHVVYALERKVFRSLYAVAVPQSAGKRIALLSEDANKCPAYAPEGTGLLHAVTYDARSGDLWDLPDAVVEAEMTSELRAIIPHFPERSLFTIVHRWPQNMCIARPHHFESAAAFERRAETIRGVTFAGDYLSLPCIDGAVASGVRAARRLLDTACPASDARRSPSAPATQDEVGHRGCLSSFSVVHRGRRRIGRPSLGLAIGAN